MERSGYLNSVYKPLWAKVVKVYDYLLSFGYNARVSWCNMHKTLCEGAETTNFFPLPEIELDTVGFVATIGFSLDGETWIDLIVPKGYFRRIDFCKLAQELDLTIYAVADKIVPTYAVGMDVSSINTRVEKASANEIHVGLTGEENLETIRLAFNACGFAIGEQLSFAKAEEYTLSV